MILAFDFTSWYAAVIYVVGGVLVLVAAGEKLFGWSRWLRQRLWPEPPQRPLVLRDRSFTYSTETVPERRLEPRRYLEGLSATYRVENKEPKMTVLDISSGVRRKGRWPGAGVRVQYYSALSGREHASAARVDSTGSL